MKVFNKNSSYLWFAWPIIFFRMTLEFHILQLDHTSQSTNLNGKGPSSHSKARITRLHFGMIGSNCPEQYVVKMIGLYSS